MKWFFFVFFFFFLSLVIPSPSHSTKRALLIGINDYKNLPAKISGRGEFFDLRGSLNDVRIMHDILTSKYGFSSDRIKTLTESDATRTNIKKTFDEWLVSGSNAGDLILFFFSGHGSHVLDQNADENDGMDEVLCPYDFFIKGENIIRDDDLGTWLRRLRGRDVVVIIDSCYSGTMTRRIGKEVVSILEHTPSSRSKFVPINYKTVYTQSEGVPPMGDEPEGQIFMAAAREGQLARESNLEGKFHGIFTHSLVNGLKKLHNPTYLGLYNYVKKGVKDHYKEGNIQEPQIEPSSEKFLDWPVFNPRDIIIAQATITSTVHPETLITAATTTSTMSSQQTLELPSYSEIEREKLLVAIDQFEKSDQSIMKGIRSGIGEIPYVEIVDGGKYFDRLIRGEMTRGEINARVLNSIGDVIKLKPASDTREIIDNLAPHLEYAYIVKQLTHITNPNPAFKTRVWVTDKERRDFRVGEKIVFNFWSEEDCYLLMLNLDKKGNFHIIFPNKYHQESFIPGGKAVSVPDERMRRENFEFMFDRPAGEETVKIIATSEKLNLKTLGLGKFGELFQTISGSASAKTSPSRNLVRDIIITLRDGEFKWSEDMIVVRSHE